ncbi:MAG TPA: hypothetical protein VFM93_12715 [Candidatus Limnocylindria bacterium]|nr:hypothetical protein [Candidatus Limnocylindria bacterium]
MRRRTLDITFAAGGLLVAGLLAVLGLMLMNENAFARNYVKEEMAAQKIVFATAEKLTDAEKNWKPGSSCLVTYAGQQMETGAQAECYAKYFIREHMDAAAKNAGFPGATYATLGGIRSDLTAQINAAKQRGDTGAAADLQKKFDAATSLRSTMQSGETLSGMLLTVYGFSVIGEKAGLAANIMYALAGLMAFLAIAGFVHAFVTPKEKLVFGPLGQPVPRGI